MNFDPSEYAKEWQRILWWINPDSLKHGVKQDLAREIGIAPQDLSRLIKGLAPGEDKRSLIYLWLTTQGATEADLFWVRHGFYLKSESCDDAPTPPRGRRIWDVCTGKKTREARTMRNDVSTTGMFRIPHELRGK